MSGDSGAGGGHGNDPAKLIEQGGLQIFREPEPEPEPAPEPQREPEAEIEPDIPEPDIETELPPLEEPPPASILPQEELGARFDSDSPTATMPPLMVPSPVPSGSATAIAAPRARGVRIVAVSGAKGGVGKTILASNLALYLATIGRRVVLADTDVEGANVHTVLGLTRPDAERIAASRAEMEALASERDSGDGANGHGHAHGHGHGNEIGHGRGHGRGRGEEPLRLIDTNVPGLRLLDAAVDTPALGAARRLRRARLLGRMRELDTDYVVVDLGSGTESTLLDFYLAADLSVYVTSPEPTALENTYRFLRGLFARAVLKAAPDRAVRHSVAERLRRLGGAPAPLDLVRWLETEEDSLAILARATMETLEPRVILNQTRLRADLELGDSMRSALRRRHGLTIDYLGHVDYDDTVWSCVRMRRPLLVESPGTKASKSIEKIARRILAIDTGKGRARALLTVPPDSHHDLLEVDRGATDEEIRRAYKRAKEVYATDALCCHGLFDSPEIDALRRRLDEAYDVLLDPARRRPYELSIFPAEPVDAEDAPPDESDSEPRPPAPDITPETEFTGALLRVIRESKGIELKDISIRTKIGIPYLRAIEDDEYGALPPLVYVRGFVAEYAKFLKLDAAQVSRTYVRRYRRYLEDRGKS